MNSFEKKSLTVRQTLQEWPIAQPSEKALINMEFNDAMTNKRGLG